MRLQHCVRDEAPRRPPRALSGGVIENAKWLQNLRNKGKKEKKAEKTSLPVTDKKAFEAPVFEEPATSAEPLEERVSEAESDFDAWDDDDGLYD